MCNTSAHLQNIIRQNTFLSIIVFLYSEKHPVKCPLFKEAKLSIGVNFEYEVPWTAIRAKQSILKEISPEYSLEGLMLELKLQYFGHLMQRTDSLEKTLMLGKVECRMRRG